MIPVGSYRPDMADSNPGIATRALNVILRKDSGGLAHYPMPGLFVAPAAIALPADPKGGVSVVDSGGSYSVVVGTATKLYRLQSNYSWLEIGTGYALLDGDRWSFGRYGAKLYASNVVDGMRSYDVDAGGAVTAVTGAPAARFVFPMFNTLMALDCDGDNRVMRNSAIGNADIWTGKGAGSQSFPDGEELICGVELSQDLAIVWQRNAIRGLYRRNDGRLYDARLLYTGRGCVNPGAMCAVDGTAFFVDTDGFYQIGQDGSLNPIGMDKVSRTFLENLSSNGLNTIEAAVDKVNNRVVFRFQRQSNTNATIFGHMLAYDYRLQEWSEIEVDTAAIFTMATPGYDMDSLDALYPSMDAITIDMDSRFWAGGEPRLAAMNSALKFGFFDGQKLSTISETGTTMTPQSQLVTSVIALTDNQVGTVQLGVRDRLADTLTWGDAAPLQRSGRFPLRGRGKGFALRFVANNWEGGTFFRGFDDPVTRSGGAR